MKINIIAVGKIKEKYFKEAIDEYAKRLSRFCTLNIIEVDEYLAKIENDASIIKSKSSEGQEILKKIKSGFVIILDISGKEYDTIALHKKIKEIKLSGVSEINFVIGGSYGLSEEVKNKSDLRLSFSKLTFPHQLFRVILLEQIYRVFKIDGNEPYHK